jgi:hypothetical protein
VKQSTAGPQVDSILTVPVKGFNSVIARSSIHCSVPAGVAGQVGDRRVGSAGW